MAETLMGEAIERAGVVKGAQAVAIVASWTLAFAESDLAPDADITATVRAVAGYWHQSERTVWRELRRFRAVFPEHDSPAVYAPQILALAARRKQAPSPVLAGELPLAA